MALGTYYYPSWDDNRNSMLGAMDYFLLPPATTTAAAATAAASMFPSTTDHGLPYSAEEDQQLLLHLEDFLSDFDLIPPLSCALPDSNTANIYPDSSYLYQDFPLVDHSSAVAAAVSVALPAVSSYLYHKYHPQEQPPFLLDYDDHCSSFFPRQELGDKLVNCDYFMAEPPPKRQKHFHPPYTSYSSNIYSHMLTPPPPMTAFPPPPPPKFCACTPQVVSGEGEGSNYFHKGRKEGGPRAGATPQSLAARDRRKKISNKTMELGKLVPGAEFGKMNTAEMLQHAFKYVKFMQSQLSLLQLIPQEQIKRESLQIVASSAVQEKLYMKDKCLVPIDLIEQLAADGDLQSQGSISTDLKQLMQSISAQNNG